MAQQSWTTVGSINRVQWLLDTDFIPADDTPCLRLALFQDLTLYLSIDLRSGRLILRDAGDLAAWERGYRFARYAKTLNENPHHVLEVIQALRFNVSCFARRNSTDTC
jgi:hypothetical protein